MTEREQYLNHRIPFLREMLRELEEELAEIRKRRMDAYLDHLERGCNPALAEVTDYD